MFASKNLTAGQLNALVKAVGGEEGALGILDGSIKVTLEKVNNLLTFLRIIPIPAPPKFIARERFVIDTSANAKVKVLTLGSNFKSWFLDTVEEPQEALELREHKLKRPSLDAPIQAELGEGRTISLGTFYEVLRQKEAEGDYSWTFAYILDADGTERAVRAFWRGGGWSVEAYRVDFPSAWFAGGHVLSRN